MLAIIILIAAAAVVLGTAVLKNVAMAQSTKNLVATVLSLVAGGVSAYVDAGSLEALTAGGVLGTIVLVYGAAQLAYKFITKPTGLDELLETRVNG